jgi:ABC-type Fe3+-citrate transport system substrate-binding protein
MFRRLFSESKSKDRRPRDVDALQTINELQQTEDMMNKKLEKFDEEINDIQNKARQCLTKSIPDRLGAIRLIKRRNLIDKLPQV